MLADGTPAKLVEATWQEDHRDGDDTDADTLAFPIKLFTGAPESAFGAPSVTTIQSTTALRPCERITIRSAPLIKTLSDITRVRLDPDTPVSFLRPFRTLVHHEGAIRDRADALKGRFRNSSIIWGSNNSPEEPAGEESETAGPVGQEEAPEDTDPTSMTSPEALLHLQCLVDFMDTHLRDKIQHISSSDPSTINFHDIWHLFKAGDEVIDQDKKQAYRVVRVATPRHTATPRLNQFLGYSSAGTTENIARIHCVYIDFDGEKLGPVSRTFEIPRFNGEKPVLSLPIYPLRVAGGVGLRYALAARGQMLWDVIGVKTMHYRGPTDDTGDEIDSQVVIDFAEAFSYARKEWLDWRPRVELLSTSTEEGGDAGCDANSCRGQAVHDDSYIDLKSSVDFVRGLVPEDPFATPSLIVFPRALKELVETGSEPDVDEYVVMSHRAFGFVLKTRKWGEYQPQFSLA